ncbi:MAG TPA: periplasmic heavy metal sensor [Thermoanaerobaculia bacterium]|nr:periplasmic heavy metal sensor [Thermoanaerobaculia bacterium]
MKKYLIAAALLVCVAASSEAQRQMPHGKWWRRPAMASKLELTRAQQARLDEIFNTTANQLIDGKADVKKLEVALRAELDRESLRRPEVSRIVSQLSAARARLFENELTMLVEMRTVLEDHQWVRLQEEQAARFQQPHFPRPRQQ